METNLYCYTRTGRTISEKTMEDGNFAKTKDEKTVSTSLANIYNQQQTAKLTANGHDFPGEHSTPPAEPYDQYRAALDAPSDDKARKRINPLRIHLGKRPFVDNSPQYHAPSKKRKLYVNRPSDTGIPPAPRVPKLIPKRVERNKFHNVTSQADSLENERDKPVPRLVPKSQLLQFKKGKAEKSPHLKEYAQNLGLQPMVKFKCRKCCSMSFKTLAMLKEHQLVCRAQAKEPALSPEAAPNTTSTDSAPSGPSRVTRKVYLCSACGTYYENWNLFLHMREIHNRHICLFCLGMFSKAEKLAAHLANKHSVKEFNYDSKEDFFNVYKGTMYLMCCVCDEMYSEQDDFLDHDCNIVIPRPVAIRVTKNSKTTSVKQNKFSNEQLTNGPPCVTKEPLKPISDKKLISDVKPDISTQAPQLPIESSESEPVSSDTSLNSENSTTTSKDTSNTTSVAANSSILKPSSPMQSNPFTESHRALLPNGDEDSEHSDDDESPSPGNQSPETETTPAKPEVPAYFPVEKEREGGIKLKLSLNNAKSPVIINSTVDPTIGQHPVLKPPTRVRRPPKRYEKEKHELSTTAQLPRTPTIKMTICDKADNSFVKTTIYENNQETTLYSTENSQDSTLRTLLNNNLETVSKTPEIKPEQTIKSTIYDNKIEDENSMNRVPKLTVRVPKELLDKDSSSDYSSDSDGSDKLTVDENNVTIEEPDISTEKSLSESQPAQITSQEDNIEEENAPTIEDKVQTTDETTDLEPKLEPKTEPMEQDTTVETTATDPPVTDELPVIELSLEKPLDKYPLKDLLKVFLSHTVFNCIYCNHARKIAVNCEQLALHMVAEHRFKATVDSITAEELFPDTIGAKVKVIAIEGNSVYINLNTYDSEDKCGEVPYDYIFECFQCYFKTPVHKDLYLHNRKMHQKTILLCVMCKSNFYSYSELLCHLCPGTYDSEFDIKFRCCLCNVDNIPSSFRLMVHLRKIHHTCDVCLEFCHNQARLSNHVWKHKLHHLCYRCGIAYRNKPDITNHLYWKHGTQSVQCKRCLQKKWPHVYHFCSPPAIFACEECNLQFSKAVSLKVHKRFHSNEFPHECCEEVCSEKFVSKKLLAKHIEEHRKKIIIEDLSQEKPSTTNNLAAEADKESIPVIDLVDDRDKPPAEAGPSEIKAEAGIEQLSKKSKKKKLKDKDALLLDVNLPELNLSESDSSDESDSGERQPPPMTKSEVSDEKPPVTEENLSSKDIKPDSDAIKSEEDISPPTIEDKSDIKIEDKPIEEIPEEEKPNEQKVLEIWDNFKKYQEKVEKPKEKTPPLVPIRKHVCESDHDYCLIPTDLNGEEDNDKKKSKKSPKKRHGGGGGLSSSSSSSSDSDSSCSCKSNCSCSSSSGSSSSSSSDSDSSDLSGNEKKKTKQLKKRLSSRRLSDVDVTGASETPILIPEKVEPPIAETDLETEESETDEEFYDEHPQKLANKMYAEKRNQLMLLASVAPSDGGSVSGEASRPATPIKNESDKEPKAESEIKEKSSSSKKKSKKKKKSKSSKKHGPIKINIPKDVITKAEVDAPPILAPNKITISLQSNRVHIPEPAPVAPIAPAYTTATATASAAASAERKRASKRRRVPNKFYGYSSDEDQPPQTTTAALKPQLPPKLEWRKEDLPSPVTHKAKKEIPSTILPSHRLYNYSESIRLTAPVPDPEPPRILMNSDVESSDSDSSDEGGLEIYQPGASQIPIPPPSYLNSGTSSLPYAFQRPAVRQAREGESVYCYCRCPYDEVSEMIACDAEGCPIEWFHFECVGIMVPPKGKWYCPECRKNQSFPGYR